MKLVIYQTSNSTNAHSGYAYSIQLSYMIGFTTVGIGHSEYVYHFLENSKNIIDIPQRLKLLKHLLKNVGTEDLDEAEIALRELKKQKSKSSQLIVAIKKIEKDIDNLYLFYVEDFYDQMSEKFGYKIMKEYLDTADFCIYELKKDDTTDKENIAFLPEDILQRLLPDEGNNMLFFLNPPLEPHYIDFFNADDDEAEYAHNCYASYLFIFPNLSMLTSNEVALIREDLKSESLVFREKINEWATICYKNPNTTLGVDYFRENLLPLQESTLALQENSPTLNGFTNLSNNKGKLAILFGQAPIETIWKIYLDTETISQEIFDKLLEIKRVQAPKFDGRWPVAVIRPIQDIEEIDKNDNIDFNTAIQSVRKSISLE
ncbi:MAG: hypothetical protein EOO46_04370 [Flavobacterium sp.]|nr:MAG: hypothetical protein EOO46_04370 [Flavobacterium sp.]